MFLRTQAYKHSCIVSNFYWRSNTLSGIMADAEVNNMVLIFMNKYASKR